MQRRVANLPLHGGKAPPYLFQRMAKLAGAMTMAIVDEYGPDEMLRRLADPFWFQAFGCVLGFDWHSSGVTTVTCGALKEAARLRRSDLGIFIAGGKGATSRKAPAEIAAAADRQGITGGDKLVYASRMSAKVDSAAVQDGYDIYAHTFFFTPAGGWCVVQQGMNDRVGYARRYHWLGESVNDFVCEPHAAIHNLSDEPSARTRLDTDQFAGTLPLLNMVAQEAEANRSASAALVRDDPAELLQIIERQISGPTLFAPAHHPVLPTGVNLERLRKIVITAHERHPRDFETLLGTANVGPATIRSLALIAELIHNAPISHRDPAQPKQRATGENAQAPRERKWADYAYAHGGKDGTPFPVDRAAYDRSIAVLEDAVRKARVGQTEKAAAFKRLAACAAKD
jgi:hypothetical protein